MFDARLAAQLIADFESDKEHSTVTTERKLKMTPWYTRAYESLMGLFRSQF